MKTRGDSQLSSLNQRITMVSFTKTCSERIDEEREGMEKENNDDGRAFGIRKSEFEFEISI